LQLNGNKSLRISRRVQSSPSLASALSSPSQDINDLSGVIAGGGDEAPVTGASGTPRVEPDIRGHPERLFDSSVLSAKRESEGRLLSADRAALLRICQEGMHERLRDHLVELFLRHGELLKAPLTDLGEGALLVALSNGQVFVLDCSVHH
jgi:hypothetical protein